MKQVCHLVARRSAAVVAACLAGLLQQIDRDGAHTPMAPTTIAVDGGLFEHYQAYRAYLREYLDQMLGKQVIYACHQRPNPGQVRSVRPPWCLWWKSPERGRGSVSSATLRFYSVCQRAEQL